MSNLPAARCVAKGSIIDCTVVFVAVDNDKEHISVLGPHLCSAKPDCYINMVSNTFSMVNTPIAALTFDGCFTPYKKTFHAAVKVYTTGKDL